MTRELDTPRRCCTPWSDSKGYFFRDHGCWLSSTGDGRGSWHGNTMHLVDELYCTPLFIDTQRRTVFDAVDFVEDHWTARLSVHLQNAIGSQQVSDGQATPLALFCVRCGIRFVYPYQVLGQSSGRERLHLHGYAGWPNTVRAFISGYRG